VKVECIYEPPQETTDTSFTLLDDPKADRVTALAGLLGLRKVGWIFAHPPREEK
jgi:nuclear protein localization protein 4 homolog